MKDIYSPLEIDEEWDNFAPVDSAVAPAPPMPGTKIEVQGSPDPAVNANDTGMNNVEVSNPANGLGIEDEANKNTNPISDMPKTPDQWGAAVAENPVLDSTETPNSPTNMVADVDMDKLPEDKARDEAMKAMEIPGAPSENDNNTDTLSIGEIGGETTNTKAAENDKNSDTSPPQPVKLTFGMGEGVTEANEEPAEDKNVNILPSEDKKENVSWQESSDVDSALESLKTALEKEISEKQSKLDDSKKEKQDLETKAASKQSEIEALTSELTDLKLKKDKVDGMFSNTPESVK